MNRDEASILDMDTAAKRILSFSAGVSKQSLIENEEKQSAIVYQLIIIGEATKRLSMDFRNRHPDIPWKSTAAMRDVLAHQYDKINIQELWDVIHSDVPELIELLKPLIR
ncbi:MAG: DUF86 domain-containing protein [Cyanobacteria bacterium J06581_3]